MELIKAAGLKGMSGKEGVIWIFVEIVWNNKISWYKNVCITKDMSFFKKHAYTE